MSAQQATCQAIWNGVVLAESDQTIRIEGNNYFPKDAIHSEYFRPSHHSSVCPWKGTARYYTLDVDGKTNTDAVWYYPDPSPAAQQIKDYVAFWNKVRVVKIGCEGETGHAPAASMISRVLNRVTRAS